MSGAISGTCKICGKDFKNLPTHLTVAHQLSFKSYIDQYFYGGHQPQCKVCGSNLQFDQHNLYAGSCLICNGGKVCLICQQPFYHSSSLSQHVKNFHKISFKEYQDTFIYKGNPPSCKKCGAELTFRKGRYIKDECSKKCHNNEECLICNVKFQDLNRLSAHLIQYHNISLKEYIDQQNGGPKTCSVCGTEYVFYAGHYKEECPKCEFEYYCEECNKGYENRNTFSAHLSQMHNMTMRDYDIPRGFGAQCIRCHAYTEYRQGQPTDICPNCDLTEECLICGHKSQSWLGVTVHLRNAHNISDLQSYVDTYIYKGSPPTCSKCGYKLFYYKGKYKDWCVVCEPDRRFAYYSTGYYYSGKCKRSFYFRSGFEKKAMQILEDDVTVKYYYLEPFRIPYGSTWHTLDLLVLYLDSTRKIIQVKPKDLVLDPTVQAQMQVACLWAKEKGIDEVVFWTEKNLDIKSQTK